MKNAILKFFCKILPIPKNPLKNRILVVSTTALGDTLWATPTLESLRKSFPDAYIGVLTRRIGEEVLKTNPYIDQIFVLKKPLFSLWRSLYKRHFDTVLILHTSQRIALPLCALIGARRIIGTCGMNKGLDSLLTCAIKPAYEHEILRRLRMVEKIGGQIHTETLSFFPETDSFQLPPGKWIALHPGSKDGFKRWPARHFVAVGKSLQNVGYQILITGTEKALMEEISREISGSRILPSTGLHHFANQLKQVKFLICNDTGPVHLACALNLPVIAIYGPTDPHLCGPHHAKNATILNAPPTCTPCLKRQCRAPFCLLQISPTQVLEQVLLQTIST
ncbi:MAG TPA: glycosyltransferase family 9 protein [Chlamydiales bacterium]|nr:glycosyltransferase family 9 protein [Chlamydiales bacterium]